MKMEALWIQRRVDLQKITEFQRCVAPPSTGRWARDHIPGSRRLRKYVRNLELDFPKTRLYKRYLDPQEHSNAQYLTL